MMFQGLDWKNSRPSQPWWLAALAGPIRVDFRYRRPRRVGETKEER
jgi:hypothetical protein